ncbi:MAG: acyltransferase family protein [Eggerthellaceae bacterium]|nr:acyltransferase family protein [Eggerthellaceae bacterium]
MQRDAYYDNVRFVLITFVVVGHFALAYLHGASSKPVVILKDWIWLFHMPAFLFVSGMFAKGLYKPGRGLRADSICFYVVMYFLFSCVIQLVMSTYSNPVFDPFNVYRISWYFLALAILGASLPIAAHIRGGAKVVVPIAVLFALVADANASFGPFLSLGRIVNFAPFYFLGYFMSQDRFKQITGRIRGSRLLLGADVLFLALVFVVLWLVPSEYADTMFNLSMSYTYYGGCGNLPVGVIALMRVLWFALAAAMLFGVSALVPEGRTFYSELGQRTLQVYLLHPLFYLPITGFKIIPRFVTPYVPFDWLFVLLFAVVLTFVLAWPQFPAKLLKRFQRSLRIVAKDQTP